jgi:RimJ/RimL family protein N-acetyltransferase
MNNLVLTPIEAADRVDLFSLWSDKEVVSLTNWELISTLAEADQRIIRIKRRYAEDAHRVGPYVLRTVTGVFVGLIGLDYHDGEHELWYLLQRLQWGKGFGTVAVRDFIRRIEEAANVSKIMATVVVSNAPSWRLLERNGFIRVDVTPAGFQRNGVVADLFSYERTIFKTAQPSARANDHL